MMKTLKYIIFSLTIVLSLSSCKKKSSPKVSVEQETNDLIKIAKGQFDEGKFKTNTPQLQDFNEVIELNGFVDLPPKNKASVATLLEGYVKSINLLVGDHVKKGQTVLVIEAPRLIDLQQNYLEVKEKLAFLKNDFERQQTLFNEKISSQKKYLLAESAYRSSLATQTGLKNKLLLYGVNISEVERGNFSKRIRVRAPISGTISKINIVKGDFISPSQALLELINNTQMHIELQAFERDIPKIKKGQDILFKIPDSSQETYSAKVHLVGASVDQRSKTVSVIGRINKKQNFVLGMFIEASIIIKTSKQLAVVKEAVIKEGESSYVLLLKNKNADFYEFEPHEVTVIQDDGVYISLKEMDDLKDKQILSKGASMFNKD